jgi:hypothetical protein
MEVNKSHSVVTNQAIYNEQGTLLLAAGSELSEKRADILLQHKLLKPLEQCIGIASSFTAKQLYEYLNKFAGNIGGLAAVTNNENYQQALRQMCLFYEKYPLLQQNLTVLALRAPRIYFQGLFSAASGLAIAIQLNLSQKELQTVFIAGLFHDIGFLYLAPELSQKTRWCPIYQKKLAARLVIIMNALTALATLTMFLATNFLWSARLLPLPIILFLTMRVIRIMVFMHIPCCSQHLN